MTGTHSGEYHMSRLDRHVSMALAVVSTTADRATSAGPAPDKQTDTATLQCGSQNYTVDGFGRGQVLHVTGTNRNFIVTRAVRHTGEGDEVVFDSPSRADRQVLTCTTTTPGSDGSDFTFTGFFTP